MYLKKSINRYPQLLHVVNSIKKAVECLYNIARKAVGGLTNISVIAPCMPYILWMSYEKNKKFHIMN